MPYLYAFKKKYMNKIFASILFLTLMVVGFSSCKKYEEGPSLSFRSIKQRITNTWKIESYSINGAEQVGFPEISTQKQFWLGDGAYNHTYIDPITGIGQRIDGKWELQDNNNKIALTLNNANTGQPESANIFTILKLKEKSMWLRSIDNSKEYHLVPQN